MAHIYLNSADLDLSLIRLLLFTFLFVFGNASSIEFCWKAHSIWLILFVMLRANDDYYLDLLIY